MLRKMHKLIDRRLLEKTIFDKSDWGYGPWLSEPDRRQWFDVFSALPCLINRNVNGSLCGYVGVPESHPMYEISMSDVPDNLHDVHGGITYSNFMSDEFQSFGKDIWWLGFDCDHLHDLSPAVHDNQGFKRNRHYLEYRDIDYVTDDVGKLAEQLSKLHKIPEVKNE